jgi:hypothetical protein
LLRPQRQRQRRIALHRLGIVVLRPFLSLTVEWIGIPFSVDAASDLNQRSP